MYAGCGVCVWPEKHRDLLQGYACLEAAQSRCWIQIASLPGLDNKAKVIIAVEDSEVVRTHIGVDDEHGLAPGKASRG